MTLNEVLCVGVDDSRRPSIEFFIGIASLFLAKSLPFTTQISVIKEKLILGKISLKT